MEFMVRDCAEFICTDRGLGGDADTESDLDLLIVLDEVADYFSGNSTASSIFTPLNPSSMASA